MPNFIHWMIPTLSGEKHVSHHDHQAKLGSNISVGMHDAPGNKDPPRG